LWGGQNGKTNLLGFGKEKKTQKQKAEKGLYLEETNGRRIPKKYNLRYTFEVSVQKGKRGRRRGKICGRENEGEPKNRTIKGGGGKNIRTKEGKGKLQ